ncbi:MAG: class I SAM-dependent methyltransferase [Taibaiella sp.]|nr:class I SAM-dependent methyltransferase [Taibaiella sp.]
MDCRNIDVPLTRYDAIMIGFCLPYLSPREAAELIHNAAALLKSGGVLYISTMEEDENNTSGIKTSSAGEHIFMYFHNARYLLETAITAGFELLLQKRQDYPGNSVKINTDLIFIFKKR